MTRETNVAEKVFSAMNEELNNIYDQELLNVMTRPLSFNHHLKIIRYKKVKVPRYLTIKFPVIERWTDYDGEYSFGDLQGWIIHFKKFNLFKIGTKIEEEPVYEKLKPSKATIKFRRYSPLKQKKIIKKQINKLNSDRGFKSSHVATQRRTRAEKS